MATRYAVANGNWSALATWDGGASLPGVGDDVYANGYTVTIDQDITVNKIANYASAPAVAGGNNKLYSEDNTSGVPVITDVRDGVVFGAGGGLTGTLAVPPPAAVGIGVPVDNTVGTAAITATDMQNAILGKVADGIYTVEDLIKIMAAIMAGKTTITNLGGGLATVTFRNLADTINKVVADMNGSNRTNLTITP